MFGPLSFIPGGGDGDAGGSLPRKTKCLCCNEIFDLKLHRQDFLNHLLECHSLIIKDSDCIINLDGYINEWSDILKKESKSLKDICSPANTTESKTADTCYVLSDSIKQDKQLREKLNKQSLEKALDQQKLEREDNNFSRKCIFCRHVITPTRSCFLTHLSTCHNLQLGKPDNLVFIDHYLDLIQQTIDNLKCIFCEKSFKDRNVLKEHMRKKLHKRVNPSNSLYDQFYMVNYLAPGVANKRLRERKRRKSDEDEEDCDWSDWKEENIEPIVCLFCTDNFLSWDSILQHLTKDHMFDFALMSSKLDFYQQVKLVNYIRHCVYKNLCINCGSKFDDRTQLLTHMKQEKHFHQPERQKYDQPEYFFPTYENDGFLYHLDDSPEPSLQSDDEKVDNSDDKMKGQFRFIPGDKINRELDCFFCSYVSNEGNKMLDHMYDNHHFDYYLYTHPYNFMDRVKLITYTRDLLSKKKCILEDCKENFADMESLSEHMKVNKHYDTPHQNLWIHTTAVANSCSSSDGSVNQNKTSTVDYLYTLENVDSVVKEVDREEISRELLEKDKDGGGRYSDADIDEESDSVPILCLFCSDESDSFQQTLSHMSEKHNFSYVNLTKSMSFYDQVKMITYVRKMITKVTCPVCLHVSQDKQSLDNHMETEKHCIIPPQEHWDKSIYYPASFGGDAFLSELNVRHATDTLTTSINNSITTHVKLNQTNSNVENKDENKSTEDVVDCGGSADSDWGDWDEEMKIPVQCLLCNHVSESWIDIHPHMKKTHHFSYIDISSGLNFYDQVKLVNYIRSQVSKKNCFVCEEKFESNEELLQHCQNNKHLNLPDKTLWDKDEYLKPHLSNDGFLSHIDDGDSDDEL